jgi:acyl-ACP thioesterase
VLAPPLVPRPIAGRIFTAQRRIRLSDVDARGRLRLDAVARYLQDVATDDVLATGRALDERVWVVRRTRIDVVVPFDEDEVVELATWCSGTGAAAAARRTEVRGDAGGAIETETIWIHVDQDGRPVRLGTGFFDVYGEAAHGRRATTKLELPSPPASARGEQWPLRATDVDLLAHVNNTAYWHAVEELLQRGDDASERLRAVLEFHRPVDLGEAVELVRWPQAEGFGLAFIVAPDIRAAGEVVRL